MSSPPARYTAGVINSRSQALGDALVGGLLHKTSWPGIPAAVNSNVSALAAVVSALRQRALVQSREVGALGDSFVTVQDLIRLGVIDASGKTLEQRVLALEDA